MGSRGSLGTKSSRRGASSTSSSRGGGIQKHRAANRLRVDKDGDLDMGGAIGESSNKRRDSSRPMPSKSATRARQDAILAHINSKAVPSQARVTLSTALRSTRANNPENTTTLKVTGLKRSRAASNPDGGLKDLLAFIERKAPSAAKLSRPVRIKKSRIEDPHVYILVSKEDSKAIMAINKFVFAGVSLNIEPGPDMFRAMAGQDTLSHSAQETKDKLTAILQKRYNPGDKFLDLSALGDDPDLKDIGAFDNVMPEKLFKALMKICDDTFASPQMKRDAVIVVSLARNSLTDVQQVYTLANTFPDLKQLDLSNNQITTVKALRKWKYMFRQLEGLLILDNPICHNETGFGFELVKWYPRLQNLNHNQARTPEEAEAAAAAAAKRRQPQPVPHTDAVYMDNSGVGESFIREFVPAYDTNRVELAAKYYDNDSVFTLNIDTNAIKSMQNAPTFPWSSYIKMSRNILKITTKPGRLQRTFRGKDHIAGLWNQLPPTKHPDLAAEISKYIIECRPQNHVPDPSGNSPVGVMGLHLVIIGEFEEFDAATNNTGKRSFTRSITLGPGRDGKPVRVINDMLSLRTFRGVPPISEVHQNVQKIQELSEATRLSVGYAEMCLGDVGYDYQAALRLFEEKKHELPPDAFITDCS